jgi:DNA mismatch repair protein MutL
VTPAVPEPPRAPPPAPPPPAAGPTELAALRRIGQVHGQYLLAEGPGGLVLVDLRAAHERILFERLLARARAGDGPRQGLLIPLTFDLAPAEAEVLRRHLPGLTQLGFELEPFGDHTFLLRAVPPHFPAQNLTGVLRDILDDLRETASRRRGDEALLAAAACRAALRAQDRLDQTEVDRLLTDLAATELPYTCPHGRPTMINLSWGELDKRFGRRS